MKEQTDYTVKESTRPCNLLPGTMVQRVSSWEPCPFLVKGKVTNEKVAFFTVIVEGESFGTFSLLESQVKKGWI